MKELKNICIDLDYAKKLFQLKDKPVGIAFFGIGSMGTRSIGSYIREFEITNPKRVVSQNSSISNIVEEIRKFYIIYIYL